MKTTQIESAAVEGAWMSSNPFTKIKPSWKTMEQTLRQWHKDSLDDPEYLWMEPNFEDMADTVNKAVFCAGAIVDETPDDSWMARQDGAI